VIVRTAAEGKNTAELHEDLMELVATWQTIKQKSERGCCAREDPERADEDHEHAAGPVE